MVKYGNKSLYSIGILGGMFNPVHNGHLRVAVECKEAFDFNELRMFPCAEPPHREVPEVSSQQRLKMLQLALQDVEGVQADDRELNRPGPSYTIDTLRSLKSEFPQAGLYLIIGSDAFQSLNTWHEWEKILEFANIIIAQRPDNEEDFLSEVGQMLRGCFTSEINEFKASIAGKIYVLKVSQLEISSSYVRELFREQKIAKFLLPEIVLNYIKENKLYNQVVNIV